MCRQINYWIPNDPDAPDGGIGRRHPSPLKFTERRRAWIDCIDKLIINVLTGVSRSDNEFIRDIRSRTFNFYDNGGKPRLYLFQNTISCDRGISDPRPIFPPHEHDVNEFLYDKEKDLTATDLPARFEIVYFSFYWNGILIKMEFTLHNEYFSLTTYIDVSTEYIHRPPQGSPVNPYGTINNHIMQISKIASSRFDVLHTSAYNQNWTDITENHRQEMIAAHEYLYMDFWALFDRNVLGPAYDHASQQGYLRHRIGFIFFDSRGVMLHCPDPIPIDRFISPVHHIKDRRPLHETIAMGVDFDDDAAVDYTDAVWPFITAKDPADDARIEYTISTFLRKRAIHISALAADAAGNENREPMKFLVLSRAFYSSQLGRLAERLFALDSVRVAALMNLPILNRVGDDIRELTREAQSLLSVYSERMGSKAFIQNLGILRRKVAELGQECDGGLEYRIERSRYYIQQYREVEETLTGGMGIVEGFQRYDIFIRRRLFATYAFIDRLGARVTRLKRELEGFGQQVQIHQDLASGRRRRAAQESIFRIQILGEIFLILPFTYYTSAVLHKIVNHYEVANFDVMQEGIVEIILLGVFTLIFGGLSLYHSIKYRTERKAWDDDDDQ